MNLLATVTPCCRGNREGVVLGLAGWADGALVGSLWRWIWCSLFLFNQYVLRWTLAWCHVSWWRMKLRTSFLCVCGNWRIKVDMTGRRFQRGVEAPTSWSRGVLVAGYRSSAAGLVYDSGLWLSSTCPFTCLVFVLPNLLIVHSEYTLINFVEKNV